jgi:hypothetical protein
MIEEQLYYLGDTPLIKIYCVNDISGGSAFKIKYQKPDGTSGEWTGNLSGTRYIEYQTTLTDLNIAGTWVIQAFVDWGDIEKHGNSVSFKVHDLFRN